MKPPFHRQAMVFLLFSFGFMVVSMACASVEPASEPTDDATQRHTSRRPGDEPGEEGPNPEALIQALSDSDCNAQNKAQEALIAKGQGAVEPLIAFVRRPYSEEKERLAKERAKQILCGNDPLAGAAFSPRQWAIRLLGDLKDPRAVDVLLDVLYDSHSYAQTDAASSLGSIGDPRAIEPLRVLTKDEKNLELASAATYALGEIGPSSISALVTLLQDRQSKLRFQALGALGMMNDGRAVQILLMATRDKDPVLRGSVFWYLEIRLRKNGSIDGVELILRALKDPSRLVRTSAARMIGIMKESRGVVPLIDLGKERDWLVRRIAYDSLLSIKDPRAVEPIIADLKDSRRDFRLLAAWALGEFQDVRAIEPLTAALRDRDAAVQAQAESSLTKIRSVGK